MSDDCWEEAARVQREMGNPGCWRSCLYFLIVMTVIMIVIIWLCY